MKHCKISVRSAVIHTHSSYTCLPLSQWDVPLINIHALTLYTYKLPKTVFTTGSYIQHITNVNVTDVTRVCNQQAHLLHSKDHKA
jgi:hypothetical protein